MELLYHEALTRPALAEQGFGPGAQTLAVWGNWSTDIWTLGPLARTTRGRRVARLHFTDLPTPESIAAQWVWLAKHAVRTLPTVRTPFVALYELGQLLHSVQDFYAHTNWVELSLAAGAAPDAVPTWEQGLPAAASRADLVSAYYPDSAAPRPELSHFMLHKDHPDCSSGAEVFAAAMGAARRATLLWLPRLLALVPATMRPTLPTVSRVPLPTRALLLGAGLTDRVGLTRWIAGGPPPWRLST